MAERLVYFIRPVGQEGPVKIGCSKAPVERLKAYLPWSPVPLEIVAVIEGDYALEGRFHREFQALHTHHEWFRPSAELSATIREIQSGRFDPSSLPKVGRAASAPKYDPAVSAYKSAATKLAWMRKRGVPIPREISSGGMWRLSHEELARRRALIVSFVAAHGHPVPKKAA